MISLHPISDFANYTISTNGRIWSKPRRIKYNNQIKGSKWLLPYKNEDGYLYVKLYKNNKGYMRAVHRLVLETFIGPCPEGMECRHLDGNPANNCLDNLCWGTQKENVLDALKHGTHSCLRRGDQSNRSRLREQEIKMIRGLYRTGLFTQKEIADLYGVTQTTIWRKVNNRE